MNIYQTYEEQIKGLYKEFNEKKALGLNPSKDIYKRRKKFLQWAIIERDGGLKKVHFWYDEDPNNIYCEFCGIKKENYESNTTRI